MPGGALLHLHYLKYFNSRLKVTLSPKNIEPVIVPRDRVQSFMEWLEGA